MPLVFACISPHPPIILPEVGSKNDRQKVGKTIENLEFLGGELKKTASDLIIISSPHPEWGIKVPLHFLNSKIKNQNAKLPQSTVNSLRGRQFKIQNYQNPNNPIIKPGAICPILTTIDSPMQHFEWGKQIYNSKIKNLKLKIALIASGDLSHRLKEDGPYGFHPDGPAFDEKLIKSLKNKDIETILKLDKMYPEAGECGLRSFCFLLGILEESKKNYIPEVLSYEGPFGVGYLTLNFKIS